MPDFTFTDAGFAATTMAVQANNETAAAWLADRLGSSIPVLGATMRKSGGYQMIEAVAGAGMTYAVDDAERAKQRREIAQMKRQF